MSGPTPHPRGCEAIKALASELGLFLRDVLVEADDNDPFYCGRPAPCFRRGMVFPDLEALRLAKREFTYDKFTTRAVVQGDVLMRDSETPYVNTDQCWKKLPSRVHKGAVLRPDEC